MKTSGPPVSLSRTGQTPIAPTSSDPVTVNIATSQAKSPQERIYLRSFVVARVNPLRWIKGEPPPLEEVLKTMRDRAARFNVEKIKPQDLAGAAGPPDDET